MTVCPSELVAWMMRVVGSMIVVASFAIVVVTGVVTPVGSVMAPFESEMIVYPSSLTEVNAQGASTAVPPSPATTHSWLGTRPLIR